MGPVILALVFWFATLCHDATLFLILDVMTWRCSSLFVTYRRDVRVNQKQGVCLLISFNGIFLFYCTGYFFSYEKDWFFPRWTSFFLFLFFFCAYGDPIWLTFLIWHSSVFNFNFKDRADTAVVKQHCYELYVYEESMLSKESPWKHKSHRQQFRGCFFFTPSPQPPARQFHSK